MHSKCKSFPRISQILFLNQRIEGSSPSHPTNKLLVNKRFFDRAADAALTNFFQISKFWPAGVAKKSLGPQAPAQEQDIKGVSGIEPL